MSAERDSTAAARQLYSLARFPDENPFPVLRIAADGRVLYANGGSSGLLESWNTAVGRKVPAPWQRRVAEILASGASMDIETRIGDRIYALTAVAVAAKRYVNFYGRDITDRKKAEEKLRLDAQVFENAAEGILITDGDNRILDVNKAFTTITGYSREEVLDRDPGEFKSGKHDGQFYQDLWDSLRSTGSWQGEIWDRRKNGEVYPKWLSISAVTDSQGQTTHYIGVFTDITTKKQTEDTLYYMAHYDGLTGLANRSFLRDRLVDALHQARQAGQRVAVLSIDLDGFKIINDNLGHRLGDAMLREVGERLKDCIVDIDTVARMGGDEFAMVLAKIERSDQAAAVAQEVLNALGQPFFLEAQEVYVSASIGIGLYPYDSTDADELLMSADAAMYRAKQVGRNTIQFSSPEINRRTSERLQIYARLRHAVEGEELELYYQPQIDTRTNRLIGVEALLRWNDPELGSVPPQRFIPLAEETGMIHAVGEFVLRGACRQCQRWQEQGLPALRIAVNLSAQQLKGRRFAEEVARVLSETKMPTTRLELELTESMLVEDFTETIRKLERLKSMGLTLAIDDFGTGYSSLSYLKRLPIDRLKIDKSFILGIPEDESDVEIAAAIIAMGQSLRLEVLAEGVETEAQMSFLKERNCHLFQGYLCSPPVPPDKLVELVRCGHCGLSSETN